MQPRMLLALAVILLAAPANAVSSVGPSDFDSWSERVLEVDPSDTEALREAFMVWAREHGKLYGGSLGDEHSYDVEGRFAVFSANAAVVAAHNEAYRHGATSYAMSLRGPFADLSAEEFTTSRLMTPQNCSATHHSSGRVPFSLAELPAAVDWRTHGVVTPIKNQAHCGSCWTFSTTGTLEARHCIAHNIRCDHWSGLSEQQLVDCAWAFDNRGCEGGLPSHAFEYIKYSGGIDSEEAYEYKGEDEACAIDPAGEVTTVQSVHNITAYDEDEIVRAVADSGPVAIAYQVASDFRFYSHGVYDSYNATTGKPVCQQDPGHVNHAVVVVGYGDTMADDPVPFYIVRNSWGNEWGMEGYFWLVRGKNMCGVSDCASFPMVNPVQTHNTELLPLSAHVGRKGGRADTL